MPLISRNPLLLKFSTFLFSRARWLNVPGAVLIVLLQRFPALRVAATADGALIVSRTGAPLRSAIATAASLGAVHALAGATAFVVRQNQNIVTSQGDPPRITTPFTGAVGVPIAPVLFTVNGATAQPGSFQIASLPPGLSVAGANSSGLLNASSGVISGTPTTAGTFSTSILAWEFAGGPATPGNDTFGPITLTFIIGTGASSAPVITKQPLSQVVSAGAGVTLSVGATGSPAPTFLWKRNGAAINGATDSSLVFSSVQSGDAGDYSVVVSNSMGSVTSDTATLTVTSADRTARLSNLSVRTTMTSGQTLIVGVVVSDGARDVLVRAAGPALTTFGLSSVMADPQLELFRDTTSVAANNDWAPSLAPMFTSVGAFPFANGSKDAAFVPRLDAAYSIQARGTGPGVVLVEAYDTGPATPARLVNVSARNRVGVNDDILIAGFTISGTGSKPLLIRAIGPKLGAFNVGGFLVNPKLEIYDGAGAKVTENDDWNSSLAATFTTVGAFALDVGSRDAALVTALPPGGYTAQVRGADGGTGEALIEIYELP